MSTPTMKSSSAEIKEWVTRCVKGEYPEADVDKLWTEGLTRNAAIVKMLRAKADAYKQSDRGRFFSHIKAANSISGKGVPIVSGEMARNLPFVGESIGQKIDDFLESGEAEPSELQRTVQLFSGIWGVAEVASNSWYKQGYRTIEQLRANPPDGITEQQRIGLKYYEQLLERVPRDEITRFHEMVRAILPASLITEIAGSYRRELPTSGDVDLLILDPTNSVKMSAIEQAFRESGIAKDAFKSGPDRYTAVMSDGKRLFKVDVFLVSKDEWAANELYATGSVTLNRSMRARAKRMGMLLNQHGLFKNGVRIPTKTEKDIFDALGMKYLRPSER